MSEVYLGNPNLKKANTAIEFSQEEILEFMRCKEDPVYFAKNYIKIVSLDEGLTQFHPYHFQEKLINNFHENRFNICKMPRQTGKSTTVVSYLLHYAVFNDSVNIGILANKAATARELLGRLQTAYENLPKWMQQGIIAWNKGSLELENGSKILAASTSASAVRGMSFNILFLDEFAFVPNHVADSFFASVYPTITSGKNTKVIIVSTPHGMNHFYRMWHDAENGSNEYIPTDVHWSEVPGRDEKWKSTTIANTSEAQFKVEFECEFLGSVNTLIAPSKLRTFVYNNPIQTNAGLDVYQPPEENHDYVMTVDVARGVGEDYSAFVVVEPPPTVSTLETILTSIVLALPVVSVFRPTIIPFKNPVNPEVLPVPGITALSNDAVTPNPIVAPAIPRPVVATPTLWSAKSSIVQIFSPLPQVPGFFAA